MPDQTHGPALSELEMPTWPRHGFLDTLRTHWTQIVWLIGGVSAVATVIVSLLGLRITGPRDAIAAGEKRDSLLTERVVRLEQGAIRFEFSLKFQSYLLCKQARSADPVARDRCDAIIADMQSRGAP